ncbi:uncharacterized protein LOC126773927 [Nymphalis io]|uniref:uncharacterized protein LOC126773927 n=1 Tax=Inachis io TaxID=171585 RepID=UPI002169AFEE|nr:uncharacterized protein LOC126773927 [Nymphalis io]
MKGKLVRGINILFCLLLKETVTQYNSPVFSEMQQFLYNPNPSLPNIFQQYPNQEYVDNKRNFNYEEYNDYMEDNTCSCDDCDNLKPSCRNMCPNCAVPSSFPVPGYVFLPYPYPYLMTSKPASRFKKSTKTSHTVTSTIKTTCEATTQKTTKEVELQNEDRTNIALIDKLDNSKVPDVISKPLQVKDKSQYMMTALRRTKPNWVPKYGILPISDQFAEKLMLQLRSMKLLHPRKDYLRDVDNIKLVNY